MAWIRWEGENFTLIDGWSNSYDFPQGWVIKMMLAGETFNTFLLTSISNINMFYIKKKKIVVIYSNDDDKIPSANLTNSRKKK